MNLVTQIRSFLDEGGYASVMIFLSALALLLISIERLFYLYFQVASSSGGTMDSVRDMVRTRRYTKALQLCNQEPENLEFAVIKAGLLAAEDGREALKAALTEAVLRIRQKCETRLNYLALIASAATLLGLLGTISGLIKTFSGMAAADASEKARLLGSGIAEAMNSTAAGLIIGLVAMAVHTICLSKVESAVGKAQAAGLNVAAWLEHAERALKNMGSTHG